MERKAGKVGKGCSHLVVAKYAAAGGKFSYSDARILARLVQADISVEQETDVEFYADNVLAESESGVFAGGILKLIVDGLFDETRRYIEGVPEPQEVTYGEIKVQETRYTANAQPPYVAVGLVLMGKSGANVFEPVILPKVKFKPGGLSAKTKEKTVSYQTQDLEAAIHRGDDADGTWKISLGDFDKEAEAIAALDAVLGLTAANG